MADPLAPPILVLGMHRSGTSALAGLLSLSGVDFGDRLIPADPNVNPKGFWEHEEMVALHDRTFAVLGMSWQDPRPMPADWHENPAIQSIRSALRKIVRRDFARAPVWGLKDPRLCRLLPLWRPLFKELGIVPRVAMILRHPIEVAASLHRRDRIDVGRALVLWCRYIAEATQHTPDWPCVVIRYEDILRDWAGALERIARELDLPIHSDAPDVHKRVGEFIEPNLRHHTVVSDDDASRHPLSPLAEQLYAAAESRTGFVDVWHEIASQLEALAPLVIEWSQEVERLRDELDRVQRRADHLDAEVHRVKSTALWRITAPLRAARNLLFRQRRDRG